jgi:nitrite reductase (NADH) large subunit
MKAVVVGNGLAGTIAAKTLRELDDDIEIVVFAEESHPYYPRPNLIEFLSGTLPREKLGAFPEEWNVRQRIDVHLGEKVVAIEPSSRTARTSAHRESLYDVLLLAPGARAAVPPIKGTDKEGVFLWRTLDDALSILGYLAAHPRVAVVGGGLLGLETARALRARGADVLVVEVFDRLLPRQLDGEGASILRSQIEKTGIAVRCGTVVEEIFGGDAVAGLRFKDGDRIETDMVVISAGVTPDTALAQSAGLDVRRGVVVDDRMRTSIPGIFAAGDVAEHKGRCYGIIPASFEQARAAAHNMLGRDKSYEGTIPSNTLKVVGIHLLSAGDALSEAGGDEVLVRRDPEEGLYLKLVLRDGRLRGAIWMGKKRGMGEIARLVSAGADVGKWRERLLAEDFDFGEIFQ